MNGQEVRPPATALCLRPGVALRGMLAGVGFGVGADEFGVPARIEPRLPNDIPPRKVWI